MKKEVKSIKSGTRFKPSVYEKLHILSKINNKSLANMIEYLILESYKNTVKESNIIKEGE